MAKYKTIETWIDDALTDADVGTCTAMCLLYHKPMGGTKEVYTQKLGGKTWTPETLSKLFRGKAETFCQDKEGNHTFELQCFYDNKSDPLLCHEFKVIDGEVKQGKDGARVNTEYPNEKGLTAMAMQGMSRAYELVEKMASQAAVNMQTVMENSIRRDQASYEREQELRKEVADSYVVVMKLLNEQSDRQHMHELERMKFERNSVERALLMKHLPGLINGMSDNPVFPQSSVDQSIVEMIAENVTKEDIQFMVASGKLDEKGAMMLSSRINQYHAQKKKEQEELKRLAPANAEDPREDAAGNSGASIVHINSAKKTGEK